MLDKYLLAPFRMPLQVRLPESHYPPAACPDVSILRMIKSNATQNARFPGYSFPVMPVISVKLDDQERVRDEGINTEFACERSLTTIGNSESVQNAVPSSLATRDPAFLLPDVHPEKHDLTFRVSIPAGKRAVSDVACLAPAWRPAKFPAANEAIVFRFVSALPGRLTGIRAESCPDPTARHVKRCAAPFARQHRTCFPLWFRTIPVTFSRAVSSMRRHAARYFRPAPLAYDSANLVACISFNHNPRLPATIKPIKVIG